ncbi:MAG: ABC transporter permease [candidate division WOR-3 bacterium]
MRKIWMIIWKEMIHLKRDKRSMIIVFVLPLSMIILYGYAISFDLKGIPTGVVCFDRSPFICDLIFSLSASLYFKIINFDSPEKLYEALKGGRIKCGFIFPPNFSKDRISKGFGEVQVLIDSSDGNLGKKIQDTIQRFFMKSEINIRFLYNPELKSRNFIIPGLMVVLMTLLSVVIMTRSIVGEKERGSFEMLSSTPLKSNTIIFGKIIPYGFIAFINVFIVTGFSFVIFRIPFRGSLLALAFYSLIFLFPTLSIGAMISSYAKTELTALLASYLYTMLPSIILSGFIFPIENMPKWLQPITFFIPATHFLKIVRGIFLKGINFFPNESIALFSLGIFYFIFTIRGVRRKVN